MFNLEDQIRIDKAILRGLQNATIIALNYRFEHREKRGTVKFAELTADGTDSTIQLTSRKFGCISYTDVDYAKHELVQQAQEIRRLIGDQPIIVGYYLKNEKEEVELGPLRIH